MKKIIFATGNEDKMKEIRRILADPSLEILSLKDAGIHADIDENGKYILVNSKFISTDGEISKKTNSNLAPLEVNDLVFVMSDVPNGKALAKFCLIKEDNLYTLNQRIGLLKIKKGN